MKRPALSAPTKPHLLRPGHPPPTRCRADRAGSSSAALLVAGLIVLLAQSGSRAQPTDPNVDPLKYDRGFLVTGNYVAGGVDLTPQTHPAVNGFATGIIPFNNTVGNAVPPDGTEVADIVGAYLYYEAIYAPGVKPTQGVMFRGFKLDPGADSLGANDPAFLPVPGMKVATTQPVPGNVATCWGAAGSPSAFLSVFRFDVLHLLPKLYDSRGVWTGKVLVNDNDLTTNADLQGNPYPLHTVTLPEKTGDSAVQVAGATLVVVYRRLADPLTKIVFYENENDLNGSADDVYTLTMNATMSQRLQGFYQHAGNAPRLTFIVGGGGNNQTERLYFNPNPNSPTPLAVADAFPQTSPSSDRSWAFPTLSAPLLSMAGTASEAGYGVTAVARIDHQNANPNDCLAITATVFSTPVLDGEGDGLPDPVENSSTVPVVGGAWRDPDNRLLPNLSAMQASSLHKDMFVEINAMKTNVTTSYGSQNAPFDSLNGFTTVNIPAHDHMPSPEVLKMVGDAYRNAPITNADGTPGIWVHFDVGLLAASYATLIHGLDPSANDVPPDAYIVQAQPRGGESIVETACDPSAPFTGGTCHFPDYPGTVGWRFGFELLKNGPVGDDGEELTTVNQMEAWQNGTGQHTDHRRRFDPERRPFMHYILLAHARGKPKALPCLINGLPAAYPSGTSCSPHADNPLFADTPGDYHVPSSASGVAHLPGGSALVTLGLWDKNLGVGSAFVQAATIFHELGHNLNLWHGGRPADWGRKGIANQQPADPGTPTYLEPNCKPNYFSSMSYHLQAHGLVGTDFQLRLDYSRVAHNNLDETALVDGALTPVTEAAGLYRRTWYAPASSALAAQLGVTAATRLCNGIKFPELLNLPATPMARVWATALSPANDWNVPIDWHGDNGTPNALSGGLLNTNFDGEFGQSETFSTTLHGFNDWAAVRLDQIGAGRSVARFVTGLQSEASGDTDPFSGDTDPFSGDTDPFSGDTDPFSGDTDPFSGDTDPFSGDTDPFSGDTDPFSGDLDPFSGDTDPFSGTHEVDFNGARGLGRTPPSAFRVCLLGGSPQQNGCIGPWVDNNGTLQNSQPQPGDPMYHGRYTTWTEPSVGSTFRYHVFRATGGPPPTLPAIAAAKATRLPTQRSWVDTEQLPNNVQFTYFARAEFDDSSPHEFSGAFNFATIAAVNDWPVANPPPPGNNVDSYTMTQGTALVVPSPNLPGVLNKDTDSDSPTTAFRATLVTAPTPASAVAAFTFNANGDGGFTLTPFNSFKGTITFTYRVSNGNWSVDPSVPMNSAPAPGTSVGTVTIEVIQGPKKK